MNSMNQDSLRSYYKPNKFPKDKVNPEVMQHKDLLFSDQTMEPVYKKDLSESFIKGDDTMKNIKRKNWKTDNKFAKAAPQKVLSIDSQSFCVSVKIENEESVAQTKVSNIFNESVVREIEKMDGYYIPFNIKYLFMVNDKLKFSETDPLWYINCGSGFVRGPISSKDIEDLYLEKKIDGKTEIRMIDNFRISGKTLYAFFKLKELEDLNFVKTIEVPSMSKYSEELDKIKEAAKVVAKTKPKFQELEVKPKNIQPVKNETKQNVKKVKPDANKSKINLPISTGPSIIDQIENEENETKQTNAPKKNNKKKQKGKPVDFDIKLGFFTQTQQEKDYEPIIIVGDKDD